MNIAGTGLSDTNTRLRFFVIVFMGILAFGSLMYWRQKTIVSAEYVEFPIHQPKNPGELKSKNFQIDVQDASPSVK